MAYYDSGRSQGNYFSSIITFRGFPSSVTMEDILDIFSRAGDILNARVYEFPYCGTGIVTYTNIKEARKAVELFDYLNYNGSLIRVNSNERNPVKKRNGFRTVVLEDFDSALTEKELKDLFKDYGGDYVSFKLIISESNGTCAVVEFEKEEAAEKSIKELDSTAIKGHVVTVSPYIPESVTEKEERERRGRTVKVSNFSKNVGDLRDHFAHIGYTNGVETELNEDGKCIGYVTFEKIQDANKAIKTMNGYSHDNKRWVVEWAQPEPRCIIVKNLQESVTRNFLYKMFAPFGWIIFCKVRDDSEGTSGFVQFREHEDAARAVKSMNGKAIARKPLSVAFARKTQISGVIPSMAYYDSGRSQGGTDLKGKSRSFIGFRSRNYTHESITFRGFPSSIKTWDIHEIFGKAGDILDVEIYNFPYAGSGLVTYANMEEVTNALELFDYLNYKGNLIRVDSYLRKPVKKTNRCRTVVMEGFDSTLTEEELQDLFEECCDDYVSFKLIISDSSGRCAVVEFEKEETAELAIKKLDNMAIKGQLVTVSPYIPESVREEEARERRRTVVVRNFSKKVRNLGHHFANIGHITDVEIERNEDGSSKCGYVTFENIQDAADAITRMNGHLHDNKCWVVEWSEPEPRCIIVKNLQVSVSKNYLYEMFAPFGWVKFCKVMVDSEGTSGFVRFRKHEEAARAVRSMKGTEIAGKTLSVAFAREVRKV